MIIFSSIAKLHCNNAVKEAVMIKYNTFVYAKLKSHFPSTKHSPSRANKATERHLSGLKTPFQQKKEIKS